MKASDFIRPPFLECPFCSKPGTFGVLMMVGRSDGYTRRCTQCWKSQYFQLPSLAMKVVYLDQFVISNIVKSLDPATPAKTRTRLDPFYLSLFEKVDRLCKLHLVICPDSPIHHDESVVTIDFKKLKRIYELLSNGVTFDEPNQIRNAQILKYAKNWIIGETTEWTFNAQNITHQKINEWRGCFQIALNTGILPGLTNDLRETRCKKSEGFALVHEMWRGDKKRGFWDWFNEERLGLSKAIKQTVAKTCARHFLINAGKIEVNIRDMLPDSSWRLFMALHTTFCEAGYTNELALGKVWECLESDDLQKVPFVRISCLMFAAMAQLASRGKKNPSKHPFNDTDMIAAYLPYCDAMFIDKEMSNVLREKPLPSEIKHRTRIFSLRSRQEFLAYLDEIESNAPKDHITTVRSVYGEDWEKPYLTALQDIKPDEHN